MTTTGQCPRCQVSLVTNSETEALACEQCGGQFVDGTAVKSQFLEEAADATSDHERLNCPVCQTEMSAMLLGEITIDRCSDCNGVWLDVGEEFRPENRGALQQLMLYSLSLPERIVRSTVGMAAGAAFEAASLLVPQSFQSAKTYQIVVRNSLSFLIENVGGVESKSESETTGDDFMARKAVGNFVDLAGMATLHVSPLWILAIVSDVAYGTKSYVRELAKELEQQGLIDDSSTIHQVDDVLEAIQDASGNAASLFDTPPLSVDQLRETLNETRAALNSADYASLMPEAELRQYWDEMKGIAARDDVSLLGVSGALAMNTLGKLNTVSQGALTGIQVVGGLFNRHVIDHYVTSLKTIHEQGLFETVRDTSAPYVEAVWNNFSDDRPTWTEEVVTGKAIVRGWKTVSGWFTGQKESDKA